jgi:carbon-monoxide dehydrogenase medium subunit
MIPFEIVEAASLSEAVAALDPEDVSVRPIAGGTALMLMMKAGVFQPTRLVSLRGASGRHAAITAEADGSIRIGALVTLASLEDSTIVREHLPVLTGALRTLANVRVRNVATVGGALAHGDPHMDLPPVLIALGAKALVLGPDGERVLAVEDLVTGYYETQLARNELISEIVVPPQDGRQVVYLKCTTRAAHDWPALGIAVAVSADHEAVCAADLVISAATERAVRVKEASALLVGQEPSAKLLHDVGEATAAAVDLIDDMQGSVFYKQQLVRVYVQRALRQALKLQEGALR